MSRAFIKEDAGAEEVSIPPRAPLPAGTPNYLTPRGLALLEAEQTGLLAEIEKAQNTSDRAALALLQGRLELLQARLQSAQVVDPASLPQDTVHIGATVTVKTGSQTRRLSIVGVDEADALAGRVAFTAPIAEALLGQKVGQQVPFKTAKGTQVLELLKIEY